MYVYVYVYAYIYACIYEYTYSYTYSLYMFINDLQRLFPFSFEWVRFGPHASNFKTYLTTQFGMEKDSRADFKKIQSLHFVNFISNFINCIIIAFC